MKTYQEFINESDKYAKHVENVERWNKTAGKIGFRKLNKMDKTDFQKRENPLYNIEGIDFTSDKEKIIAFKSELDSLLEDKKTDEAKLAIKQFEKEVENAQHLGFIKRSKMQIKSLEILKK